jgi:hypothetical protein
MLIHSAEITGSVQFNNTDVSGITNVAGFATTASVDALVVKTGSYASTSSVNELQSKTGSYATTSSVNDLQSVTGSFATTGSNQFNGNQSISGSITSNGTITAQTLVVQTVTSSVEFVTGSTRNGSLAENTHQFTGSVLMSGSLNVGGVSTFSSGITSNGNINLSVSEPRLTIRKTSNSQESDIIFYENNNGHWVLSDNATTNDFSLYNYNTTTNNLYVKYSNGFVGIGTSNPTNPLHVETTGTDLGIQIYRNVSGDGGSAPLFMSHKSTGGTIKTVNIEALGNGDMLFRTGATGLATFGTTRMTLSSTGNLGINDTNPSTKLSINGANYIEMATFAATAASAASIVSSNSGYVQFSNGEARHNSNTGVFTATTNGIQIQKAGIVHVNVSQDIITSGSIGYIGLYIRKNGTDISENLISSTNGQWDGINGVATTNVAVNDVIGFFYSGADVTSFDSGTWSLYSFIWSSR